MKTPFERLLRRLGIPAAILAMTQIAGGQVYHEADVNITQDLCVGSVSCWGDVDDPPDLHIRSVVPQIGLFSDAADAWRIEANRTGFKEFLIREVPSVGTARTVMQINPGARANSLFVDATGRVGLGTGAPTSALTIAFDLPSVRWIDTTGGKEWAIDANNAGFFIMEDGTDTRMTVDAGGNVGIGVSTPSEAIHVFRSSGNAIFRTESSGSGNALFDARTTGTGQPGFFFHHGFSGTFWDFRVGGAGNMILNANGSVGGLEFRYFVNGNFEMAGSLTTGGPTCPDGCDEVFEPGFALESIDEHSQAMWERKHLPAVGPTSPDQPLNVTEKVGGILNELEKAHIYIEQLHQTLQDKDERIRSVEQRLARLEAML